MSSPTMVFGDDGSASADLAWLWINTHAWPGWRLELIHATDPAVVTAADSRPEPRPWTPANPRWAFVEAGFDEVELLTIDADPRIALTRPADLVVIGPRGRGFLKALRIGSTAEWLMRSPASPVVVARRGYTTGSVVVWHDGSANAAAATTAFSRLPWAADVNVTVVGVRDARADIDGAMASATGCLEGAGATARCVVLDGEPIDELLRYLREHEADLVVLGAGDHSIGGVVEQSVLVAAAA